MADAKTAEELMLEHFRTTKKYTESEKSLIKNTFTNIEMMMAIRKVFYQFPISPLEASLIAGSDTPTFRSVILKAFNPELNPEMPLGQFVDSWTAVDQASNSRQIEDLMPIFESRQLVIDYLCQQIEVLEAIATKKDFKSKIVFKDLTDLKGKTSEEFYVNLSARNKLIGHIDGAVNELITFGCQKILTPEQIEERRKQNSSK